MWPFKTNPRRENNKLDRKEQTKKRFLTKLSKLKYNKQAIDALSQLIRDFFSEYLNLRYQFTYKELEAELKKRKIKKEIKVQVVSLLEEISETEFDEHSKITKEQFEPFVYKFRHIIKTLKG